MRKYLIEVGMGSDFHHPDPTKCAVRAVTDAIYHCTMVGLGECQLLSSMKEMMVKIKVGVPFPEKVDREKVLTVIPFGKFMVRTEFSGQQPLSHGRIRQHHDIVFKTVR